jgi:hypothetical protein
MTDGQLDQDLYLDQAADDEEEEITWMESDAVPVSQLKRSLARQQRHQQKRPKFQKSPPSSFQAQQQHRAGSATNGSPRNTALSGRARLSLNPHHQLQQHRTSASTPSYDGLYQLYQDEKAYSSELFSTLESDKLYISKMLANLEAEKEYSARLCKELVHEKSINANLQKALKEEKSYSNELYQGYQELQTDHDQLQKNLKVAEGRIKELEEGLLLPVQSASLRIQNGLESGQEILNKISEAYDHFNQAQAFLLRLLPHVSEE